MGWILDAVPAGGGRVTRPGGTDTNVDLSQSFHKVKQAEQIVSDLIRTYGVQVIAIA